MEFLHEQLDETNNEHFVTPEEADDAGSIRREVPPPKGGINMDSARFGYR